ncbi:MAG: hypothetical protein JXR97_06265 [Planctomycetes bacterium]|nr:hypothetical protein [Planctomycetota bacterium]
MSVRKCGINDLQPGMMLSQQVMDDKGRVVMPEGARLTPMYIKRLAKWGVEEVMVVDNESETTLKAIGVEEEKPEKPTITPEEREAMRNIAAIIAERFSNTSGDEVMEELKRLTVRHLVLTHQGGKKIPGIRLSR